VLSAKDLNSVMLGLGKKVENFIPPPLQNGAGAFVPNLAANVLHVANAVPHETTRNRAKAHKELRQENGRSRPLEFRVFSFTSVC
jgi:hypothetical protein